MADFDILPEKLDRGHENFGIKGKQRRENQQRQPNRWEEV
jgi:hypothetical protein